MSNDGSLFFVPSEPETTNFHRWFCSLIFRSWVGSLVSKKIPSPRFSPGSCPKAPASPPVLYVNEYQKPPVLPRFSSQMPPVLPRFFWAPPVLPRFPPGSPHTLRQPRKLVPETTDFNRNLRWSFQGSGPSKQILTSPTAWRTGS